MLVGLQSAAYSHPQVVQTPILCQRCITGWWFGTCFIFPYIGNNNPNWLIFFEIVNTTNQLVYMVCVVYMIYQWQFQDPKMDVLYHIRQNWLVVWNMNFIFHDIWDSPSYWLSCVSRWLKPPTSMCGIYGIHSIWIVGGSIPCILKFVIFLYRQVGKF